MKSSSKWPARLVNLMVIFGLAGGLLALLQGSYEASLERSPSLYEQEDFVTDLYRYSYVQAWKLAQQEQQDSRLSPAPLFFPTLYPYGTLAGSAVAGGEATDTSASTPAPDDSMPSPASSPGPESTYQAVGVDTLVDFEEQLAVTMQDWYYAFDAAWGDLEYLALNTDTGGVYGSYPTRLLELAQGDVTADELAGDYTYFAVLRYGPVGQFSLLEMHGADKTTFDVLAGVDMAELLVPERVGGNYTLAIRGALEPPRDTIVVFAISNAAKAGGSTYYEDLIYEMWIMYTSSATFWFSALLVVAAALGLGLAAIRRLRLNDLAPARMPLEASAAVLLFLAFAALDFILAEYLVRTFKGSLLVKSLPITLDSDLTAIIDYGAMLALLAVLLGAAYFAAASLWQARTLGLRRYLVEKCLIVRFFRWVGRLFKRLFAWLTAFNLKDKGNRDILKMLGVNFLAVALMCVMWFFGIIPLVAYTVVLFVVLRNYSRRLKDQHARLLDAAGQMAEGRLDVPIDEDLGPFNPLKEELMGVQQGFRRAVEAETRSQTMKTELITNVSHDLKTPLTAIITYVDLLKRDDLTDEERRSYVATLDQKSQRLKRLIEDLFEMSKASSRDIALDLAPVDLPALVRQVASELGEELTSSGIEFRYTLPQHGPTLPLDGERTSRIFENLFLNVAKYGLAGTRAYVTLGQADGRVWVEVKNVSRDELSFDTNAITERFVRGDAARSTEGSGLGLAIAKSFAEAQGGRFDIAVDGDVFKATVSFPAAGTPAPLQLPAAE